MPTEPSTQLPEGRYPASKAMIWLISVLVVLTGIVMALGIPALAIPAP